MKSNPKATKWVVFGGLALIAISATGAVTALADTLFPVEALDPEVAESAHFLTRLRVIHPILAIIVAVIAWWASGLEGLKRSGSALAIPALVGVLLLSGLLNVVLGVPVWMQVVHLALADALWIAYVLVSARALSVEKLSLIHI